MEVVEFTAMKDSEKYFGRVPKVAFFLLYELFKNILRTDKQTKKNESKLLKNVVKSGRSIVVSSSPSISISSLVLT